MSATAFSKLSMKFFPMIFRFVSGSETPLSASKNSADRSMTFRFSPSISPVRRFSTSWHSSSLIMPVSIKNGWNCFPTALVSRAATTVESTPPLTAPITGRSPTSFRIRTISSSANSSMFHAPSGSPATAQQKLRIILVPSSVCVTSGWNCTPINGLVSCAIAANSEFSDVAMAWNLSGRAVHLSPWDIQTTLWGLQPSKMWWRVSPG
mmetsp:Transcript_40208/g.87714  ORF Transcript_40208/g.87714 Transcript_40208/m.87714 type:complete len:208 (+) Transcript_40208:665-1288(+)